MRMFVMQQPHNGDSDSDSDTDNITDTAPTACVKRLLRDLCAVCKVYAPSCVQCTYVGAQCNA